MTKAVPEGATPEPCPRCGATTGLVWVHGHGQCAACGSNIHDCCQGAPCDLVPGPDAPGD